MALPQITGEFRVAGDPELRFAPSGIAVGNVRLVANSRKQVNGEWVDDKVLWIDGTLFKQHAENMVESISKGDLVVVTGRIQTESWEKDGEKKSKVALIIDHIGPSLLYATAKPSKAERSNQGGGQGGAPSQSPPRSAPPVDPWATPAVGGSEPPF